MPTHTIERDSRGRVADISGTCGSDRCPIEDVDDGIEYVCPVTDDVLATVDDVADPETPDDRRPATIDEVKSEQSKRRRRRR